MEPETIEAVRTGTRLAVTENPLGTLNRVFNELYPIPIAVAGKTGTAEYGLKEEGKKFAWMIAFAPFDKPKYAIALMVEDAITGGTSAL